MSPSVHYRVQSVIGRESCVQRLLLGLPSTVEVIVDEGEPPSPWRGYVKCLSNLPDCSHVVVLQDDTIVSRNFSQAVERVVEARPDSVIQLFVGGLGGKTRADYLDAMVRGRRFSPVYGPGIHHVVAVLWPKALAESFLEWTQEAKLPGRPPRSDDAIVGLWARTTRTQVIATVPSLVEHPDDLPSTIRAKQRAGRHRGRIAIQYIGDADPLALDWSKT